MKQFGVYEGAAYYFERAISKAEEESDTAIDSLTKGYKHIESTPIVRESKARSHTESAVNALSEGRTDEATTRIRNLTRLVEDKQSEVLHSSP